MDSVGTVRIESLDDGGHSVWVLSRQINGVTGWFCVYSTQYARCSEWIPTQPFLTERISAVVGAVPHTPADGQG